MTIKQTFIISLALLASAQANAMDRKSHGYPQVPFNNSGTMIKNTIVNGPFYQQCTFINYPPIVHNPYLTPYQPYHQPYHQSFPQPHPFVQQGQRAAAERAKKEREEAESKEKYYNELKNLYAVRDLLSEEDRRQVTGIITKCSEKEGKALAEIVASRINQSKEAQKIKSFINILNDNTEPKNKQELPSVVNLNIRESYEESFFSTKKPNDFLKNPKARAEKNKFRILPASVTEKDHFDITTTENICTQLELMQEQNKSMWQIAAFGDNA